MATFNDSNKIEGGPPILDLSEPLRQRKVATAGEIARSALHHADVAGVSNEFLAIMQEHIDRALPSDVSHAVEVANPEPEQAEDGSANSKEK